MGGASPADDARRLLDTLDRVILGQAATTREALVCLVARGHVLLEGVPGTAKTLLVRTLALALDVRFQRVQFTPDLMPADITGVTLLTGAREFTFRPGPIFADLVLADEINRAPAKTQAALLEAMQERTVTVDGVGHPLSATFTVFATQNPVEFEGTYPLAGQAAGPLRALFRLRTAHRGIAPIPASDARRLPRRVGRGAAARVPVAALGLGP